jgi:hypothetical protein
MRRRRRRSGSRGIESAFDLKTKESYRDRIVERLHPRGYGEIRSNAEMQKLLDQKIVTQNGECTLSNKKFTDYSDIVPDHINPCGMGGAWRDDHPENIQTVHWWCKREKGSSRG